MGVKRAILARAGLALTLACGLVWAAVAPARALEPGLFGSEEIRNDDLHAFTKWNEMLARHAWEEERAASEAPQPCRVGADFVCRGTAWQTLLAELAGRPVREQIRAVHAFFNELEYITDSRNWRLSDYWATPREFLDRDGDCEDYAIAKYFSLKSLGLDPARMRLVVVQDLNLDMPHAVLVVYLDDGALVLDNQMESPVRASSIVHYRPIYSINENAWWLHRAAPATQAAAVTGDTAPASDDVATLRRRP